MNELECISREGVFVEFDQHYTHVVAAQLLFVRILT